MDNRKEILLTLVIESYIKNAEPIGSKFLVSFGGLDFSEATVRNELRALEEEGFLMHPHTSAGRIPTEKGYRYYVDQLNLEKSSIPKNDYKTLVDSLSEHEDYEISRKNLAKAVVDLSKETVIIAFSAEKVYYTGLSNLFNKSEFGDLEAVTSISDMFDHCEDYLEDFISQVEDSPRYFIGSENPFDEMLSVVSARFGKEGMIALLGPKRMDYKYNFGLIKKLLEII
jgi:transcriptional regulator of heat shock response